MMVDKEQERGIVIKLDELLKEEEAKIKKKSPHSNIAMIGMVSHGCTTAYSLAATVKVLSDRGVHEVLVTSDSNIEEIKKELLELLMSKVEETKILQQATYEITNIHMEELPTEFNFIHTPSRRKNRAKNRKSKVKGRHTHSKRNNFGSR